MIIDGAKRKITLTSPIKLVEVHRNLSVHQDNTEDLWVEPVAASMRIHDTYVGFHNGWHIEESTIKYVLEGSFDQLGDTYRMLSMFLYADPFNYEEPALPITDGDLIIGMIDTQNYGSDVQNYIIKNGTHAYFPKIKKQGRYVIDTLTPGVTTLPPIYGMSLSKLFEKL
jgi:hypothetical protein